MIIANFWVESGADFIGREYDLLIIGIVNNYFNLTRDVEVLFEALENSDFEPKEDTLYQLIFDRATIQADPVYENGFCLKEVKELKVTDDGHILPEIVSL